MTLHATDTAVEQRSPDAELPFEGAHWYELADADHPWMRWRFAEAMRLLDELDVPRGAPLRVLDVGGGAGVVRAQLEAVTTWTVDLAELDPTALAHARPGRGRTFRYDVTERHADLDGVYDLVVSFDVLEHVADTGPFVEALLWHLRPGGHLLLNVPALPRAYSAYDRAAGHVRRYDRPGLVATLPEGAVEAVTVRPWGTALIPLLLARKAWLAASAGGDDRERVLERGFAVPGPVGSAVLRGLMEAEARWPGNRPLGSSLLLSARRRS